MLSWLHHLDALLRGRKTGADLLDTHADGLPLRIFVTLAVILGVVYGFFMGWYAIASRDDASVEQLIASTVKLPLLFLLTLAVTFPSLYVFSALIGCRLSFAAVLRLLVAAIVVNLAVAASLGPILGFFTLSTKSYSFMIMLNVALLGISGFVALGFLLATLRRLAESTVVQMRPDATVESSASLEPVPVTPINSGAPGYAPVRAGPSPLPRRAETDASAYGIFYIWVIIYGLVGAQMGWILRPFIGNPGVEFEWFRPRQGNFFLAVFEHLRLMMDGR